MSIYRYSRELPNGWNVRLDLLPYNETLSGAVAEQPPYGVVTIGEQTSEFDELPFGLQKPQTLKIELDWEGLTAAVRTLLSAGRGTNPYGYEGRNTWLLYSDRGTAGATYTLEFCGVEDNIDALELEPGDNGYIYNAELVDVAYYTLKTMTGYNVFFGYEPEDTTPYRRVYDSKADGVPSGIESADQQNRTDGVFDAAAYVSSFEHVMLWFRKVCGNYMNSLNARSTAFSVLHDGNFDVDNDLRNLIETAAEFYEQSPTYPRSAGSALTKSTAFLTTHIADRYKEGTIYSRLYGGLASRADKLGWGRDDITAWDILKRLAETMGVKLSYSFGYDNTTYTSPARPFVTVKWNVRRIASPITTSNTFDYQDYTIDLSTALTRPSISIRGNNVLKGEARIEGFQEEDVSEWVRISSGTEASRSINVEPIILNYPTYKEKSAALGTTWLRPTILQTNNIVTRYGTSDSLLKAHEDTKVFWGPQSTNRVYVSTSASAELPPVTNPGLYKLTLAERQVRSCLPYALVKFYSTVFAEEDSASIEVEYDLRGSVAYLPQSLGARLMFQYGAAYVFTSLPWSRAITTSIVTNWTEGKTKAKYYLMENP